MATQEWTAKPGPAEVRRLRHEIVDFAAGQGIDGHDLENLALAVSEVVTNAVMHAFCDRPTGTITVAADAAEGELTVRVADDGRGLQPRTDSPGAGLGLAIAGSVAHRIVVERPQHGGTEVSLTFECAA